MVIVKCKTANCKRKLKRMLVCSTFTTLACAKRSSPSTWPLRYNNAIIKCH